MEDLEEIVQLLTLIVGKFKDAYSRPDMEIELYKKYQSLRKQHPVKVVGRFLVIDGGLAWKKSGNRFQRSMDLKKKETPKPSTNRMAT